MNHSDKAKRILFNILNHAAADLFTRDAALVDEPSTVRSYEQMSASDKDAIDQILSNSKLKMVSHNHQLLVGRTL